MLIFAVAVTILAGVSIVFCKGDRSEGSGDIYFLWLEGKHILAGENPYARVLSGDMKTNQKYATHFPMFYLAASLTQVLGFADYHNWLILWRFVFFLFDIGIAALIFQMLYKKTGTLFSVFSSLFWLFNRWSLDISQIAQTEYISIFFLLLSFMMFEKNMRAAFLLFSVSLAVKGVTILLAPLCLIWFLQTTGKVSTRKIFLAVMAMISIPALLALPFIIWDPGGFIKSLCFNVTRDAASHFAGSSIDVLLGLSGVYARLPMLLLMALVYVCIIRRQIGRYTGALVLMCIFVGFNPVLFRHYLCWIVPFVPLSALDSLNYKK